LFLAAVATAVTDCLQQLVPKASVYIKWPNDIIVNDKKTAGILIENVVRGHTWAWSIIGIGVNIAQSSLPPDLPHASSLRIAGLTDLDLNNIGRQLRNAIIQYLDVLSKQYMSGGNATVISRYNSRLYRLGQAQYFRQGDYIWHGTIEGMNPSGHILIRLPDGKLHAYPHGSIEWIWS
jgi:BirA family biotin operon repressor/biotin-[acetyl-CoA-carboxylase] ligase